ncbi:hypothetical protein EJB05_48661, partial [Eragrostis curvula]
CRPRTLIPLLKIFRASAIQNAPPCQNARVYDPQIAPPRRTPPTHRDPLPRLPRSSACVNSPPQSVRLQQLCRAVNQEGRRRYRHLFFGGAKHALPHAGDSREPAPLEATTTGRSHRPSTPYRGDPAWQAPSGGDSIPYRVHHENLIRPPPTTGSWAHAAADAEAQGRMVSAAHRPTDARLQLTGSHGHAQVVEQKAIDQQSQKHYCGVFDIYDGP